MALIFLLEFSNVWGSLISFGKVCHNFWPTNLTVSMPYRFVLALGKKIGAATKIILHNNGNKHFCLERWIHVVDGFINLNKEHL